jgi:N-acetyl-anhydromuramyl-L-alanine amidase AmpD
MNSRILPDFCIPGRLLKPQGIVVHYFSARHVDPARAYELEVCRDLFIDLNLAKQARKKYMRAAKWPADRMFASAHLLVGRSGEVWRLVEYDQQAYHAGASIMNGRANCNAWTLGIELIGTITSRFTMAQYKALGALVVELGDRYGFGTEDVAGHDTVRHAAILAGHTTKKKYDPSGRHDGRGDNFAWAYLWDLVRQFRGGPVASVDAAAWLATPGESLSAAAGPAELA